MQKAAYERRIRYWSSDVCSSDLPGHLDRLLRGAEFRGNLLVQSGRSHQLENLPLPRRQQRQALTENVSLGTLCSRLDVQLDGFRDSRQKILPQAGLGEEIDRSGLHRQDEIGRASCRERGCQSV